MENLLDTVKPSPSIEMAVRGSSWRLPYGFCGVYLARERGYLTKESIPSKSSWSASEVTGVVYRFNGQQT